MLRWSALVGVALVVLLASGAGAATVSPNRYLGEWTADTSSQSPAAGQVFTVALADEETALAESGSNATTFDAYCGSSTNGVEPVTYFSVTTTGSGTFGGCVSGKTQGHIYTWNTGQVWYAHTATGKGETVIKGALNTSGNIDHTFTAHHPVATFLAHVKFTKILKRAAHIAELTTIKGAAEFRVLSAPQPSCASADSPSIVGGSGALAVKIVKVGGPDLVELDSLTVEPDADQSSADPTFNCDRREFAKQVVVTVTKSDPSEKDACPVGATGLLSLYDGESGEADWVKLDLPKCHLALGFSSKKAKKGSHVAVAGSFDEKGY